MTISIDQVDIRSEYVFPNLERVGSRIFKSAMSEQLGDDRGDPTIQLLNLYKQWSASGAGILVTGNIMVDRDQLAEPGNIVLDSDSDLDLFKQWTSVATSAGSKIWAQLNHPGKQTTKFVQQTPVAPSAIPLEGDLQRNFVTPRALEAMEIEDIVLKFALSAERASHCGFEGVQIHAAHGYLVNQFLSKRHNNREDKWGGSIENRMRFLMEIFESIRARLGQSFIVSVKLNSADFSEHGFDEEDSLHVIEALDKAGVDLIEVSGGTYEKPTMVDGIAQSASTLKREAYFLAFAEQARAHTNAALAVTGGFRSASGMNSALRSGATDFVGIARPMALDPNLPLRLFSNKVERVMLPRLTTGFSFFDRMFVPNITWYAAQLARMGKNKRPNRRMSVWMTILSALWQLGRFSLNKRS